VVNFEVELKEAGLYAINFIYANGNGPINKENKCATRSLYVEDSYKGAVVFPQRGTDEWSDWGFSNHLPIVLQKGPNRFTLKFEPWNNNMNIYVNRAMLDSFRLIRAED
jgi:hypothetical protein